MTADPPFDFTAQPSGDGHFLHIVPTGFLAPGRTLHGCAWRAAGRATGAPGGVDDTIRFRTAPRAAAADRRCDGSGRCRRSG